MNSRLYLFVVAASLGLLSAYPALSADSCFAGRSKSIRYPISACMAAEAPSGKLVREIHLPRTGASTYQGVETLPADGETGIYRVEFRCYEAAIRTPVTNLEGEVILWPKNETVRGQWLVGELFLAESKSPIELRIEATSDNTPANYRIADANGKLVAAGSLFKPRSQPEARIMLDPEKHPLPWRLEAVGLVALSWRGQGVIIWGQTPNGLRRMLAGLERYPRPGDPNQK